MALTTISCHCHHISSTIDTILFPLNSPEESIAIDLDHSLLARKYSGQMFTSYYPLSRPPPEVLQRLTTWETRREDGLTVFFCPRCGCHVFSRRRWISGGDPLPLGPLDPDPGQQLWGVATGIVNLPPHLNHLFTIGQHTHVSETGDGGLSILLRHRSDGTQIPNDLPLSGPLMPGLQYSSPPVHLSAFSPPPRLSSADDEVLTARCGCGRVSFHITRPNEQSLVPHSQFPDLMIPYRDWSERIRNEGDEKWWVRPPAGGEGGKKRYLAGTCACESCRLTSGFEIQSWAFIPRADIFMHPNHDAPGPGVPLDFEKLPPGVLSSYRSSQGVCREFCGGCGATVFWHDEGRPGVVDVSVGLFEGGTARAGGVVGLVEGEGEF